MRVVKLTILVAVLATALAASADVITSVTVSGSFSADVQFDANDIYVNFLTPDAINTNTNPTFSAGDTVNIVVNGGAGLAGLTGTVEYDFPCLGCLYDNGSGTVASGAGPYPFTIPATVNTNTDLLASGFVQNVITDSGIQISFLSGGTFALADFNGEVFTFAGTPVPEPGSLALLGTGLVTLAGVVRRKFLL